MDPHDAPPAPLPGPPALPREHGAWVMLALPFVLGLATAWPGRVAGWLVLAAAVLTFLAHYALFPVVQRRLAGKPSPPRWSRPRLLWGPLYLVAACASFAGAVALAPDAGRVPLLRIAGAAAAAGAIFFTATCRGAGRAVPVELLGMAATALGAPLVAIAGGAPTDERLVAAPLLAFGYLASTLAFVRAYRRLPTEPGRAIVTCLGAHAALFAGLTIVSVVRWTPWSQGVPFGIVLVRTLWGLAAPPRDLRRLGLRELGVAVAFTLAAVAVLVA